METLPSKIIRFGSKEIYLPKFTVALVRTPKLSPYHAKFHVPLNFTKLDLRDYLFHAYSVRALSIRSFVAQQPVRDSNDKQRQFFRPEAKKYMTIEMDRPFVWPKEPESWVPWGKGDKAKADKETESWMDSGKVKREKDVEALRKQAKGLLGKKKGVLAEWERSRSLKYIEGDEGEYKIRV